MFAENIGKIIAMILLLALSAFFSASETAFSSLNIARVKTEAVKSRKAARVFKLSEDFDRVLSTVLVGNNIVNITLASIAAVFFVENVSHNAGATISTVVVTVVVLIFGEVSPKSLAKRNPEAVAQDVAPFISALAVILTPVNLALKGIQYLSTKLFPSNEKHISEDELITIVDEAETGGAINSEHSNLIKNAIEFNDTVATSILVPRVDVEAVDIKWSAEKISAVFKESGKSRLPVYNDSIDDIIGVLLYKDFMNSDSKNIKRLMKPAFFIPPDMKISNLLAVLQKNKTHLAVVSDEYGGMCGIVTLEDILEELVGEILDEHDEQLAEIKKYPDGHFTVGGSVLCEDFEEITGISLSTEAITLGGFIMEKSGEMPKRGIKIFQSGYLFEVKSTEGKRVGRIKVEKEKKHE